MKRRDLQKKKDKRFKRYITFLMIIGVIVALINILYLKIIKSSDDLDSNNQYSQTSDVDAASSQTAYETQHQANNQQPAPQPTLERTAQHIEISEDLLPGKYNFIWQLTQNDKLINNFKRETDIIFPSSEEYSEVEGITCFRGNNYRNSASYGTADIKEGKLETVWSEKIGYIDSWTGVGWTGQPAIIKWTDEIMQMMNIDEAKKVKTDLKEVIYATLDGKIYFLDLDNGEATRSPIDTGYPYKGSVTVDPRGYPLLYAGQGINEKNGSIVEIGYRIFNLINQKQIYFLDGLDSFALRQWGAFDPSGIIDANSDTLFECGENGMLYSIKLNTNFDKSSKTIDINPDIIKYRYNSVKGKRLGIENSPAVYKDFIYFVDNEGMLQCVNINTMEPVWIRDVTDDTDSTIALESNNDGSVSLYTACEYDNQDDGNLSYVRKINALNGDLLWEKSYECYYDGNTNGGVLASPVIGKNDISDLVIYSIAKTGSKIGGKLVAYNKNTSEEIWTKNLDYYTWSSPVDVYSEDGKGYIVLGDAGGYLMLIDGRTGKTLDKIGIEAVIEGSPAVYGNMIVVGTRGQKIWGIKIK